MVEAIGHIEQLRNVVHEELCVSEEECLGHEHQPDVQREHRREDGGRWGVLLLRRVLRRRGGRRLGRLWRVDRPLVDAEQQQNCLQRHDWHQYAAPMHACREELPEEDIAEGGAESRGRRHLGELRRSLRLAIARSNDLDCCSPCDGICKRVEEPEVSEKINGGGEYGAECRHDPHAEHADEHRPASQSICEGSAEQLATQADERDEREQRAD
mmetsp:Transcript_6823/g.19303  ORF Transcript_6823/g.19303 Transcript_6823/m.19303 type:complete len:213 (-) Transcript_6823:85-723(-)